MKFPSVLQSCVCFSVCGHTFVCIHPCACIVFTFFILCFYYHFIIFSLCVYADVHFCMMVCVSMCARACTSMKGGGGGGGGEMGYSVCVCIDKAAICLKA